MLPSLQKHSLILATLMASLALSACGKKKNDIIPSPPGPLPKVESTSDQLGQDLPNPYDDQAEPPLPGPIPEESEQVPPAPAPPGAPPADPVKTTPPPVKSTRPVSSSDKNVLPPDYRSNDVQNVMRDDLSKRMTGAVTEDGLVYTSSSTDDLLNFLRSRNEKVDAISRRNNLEAAASVLSAKMSVDTLSNDVTVSLKIQEGLDVKVYNVAGSLGEGSASPVRKVRSGNGQVSTGTRSLEGTVKCLDLDGGCETTFVRLKMGVAGGSAIINLVFRNSTADLYFNLPGKYSDNPEYLYLREFAINTIKRLDVDEKIKQSRMSSWEVVNGRSGVVLSLKGANNELLAFAGPLLAPEAGTSVNISLSRLAKDKEDSLDLVSLNNSKLNYANWIGDARMIANNGLGQVRIALKMRKRAAFAQDQFAVTFMRRIKPIVDLTDDNLK